MPPKSATPADARLVSLASRQFNVVSSRQLKDLGFSKDMVRARVRRAQLHPYLWGTYTVGTTRIGREGHFLAAVLACGPGAALSHLSAAHHNGIRPGLLSPVHVTVPTTNGRKRRPGIVLHRTDHAIETTTHKGIPITTPGRTLVDIAEQLTPRDLERALDEAHFLNLLSDLAPTLYRHPHRTGTKRINKLLKRHTPGTTRTRSEAEEHFLAWCRRHALPEPVLNADVAGVTVDAWFDPPGLAVEVDPFHTHDATPQRRANDRARDRLLLAAGVPTFRIGDGELTDQTAAELRCAASRAGVSSSIVAKNPPTASIR